MASLKEYLKRYESSTEPEKKKKKKKVKREAQGVLVVDENPVWQKPVKIEDEEEENDSGEEDGKPLVHEDIEVKRMRRLEQIRVRRPYNAIAEDGSGWVSLSPKGFEAGSDMSPPRKRRVRNDTPSPKAEGDGVEEADLSSPRKRRVRSNTPSPKAEGEGVGEADLWPPRKRSFRKDTPSDVGAPRKHSSRLDTPSPEPNLSPPRRRRDRNDSLSPEGRKSGKEIGRSDSPDLSPPRKNRPGLLPPRKKRNESSKEGLKTGLISGRDIREEISKITKEDTMRFEQMDPSMSGRGAEPIYRDKKGERISKDEYMKSKQKQEEKPKEKKIEWGKGLAQKREAEARLQELELEKDKPFARTRDDPELDKMLKDRVRWGDPMAHLVKNKHSDLVLPDLGDDEKMKESGFIIPQDIPDHSWIKRGLDAAPNRYGIKPGRHWDGIDRSNGFEKQLFKRMNEKQATEREAYLWSVSDM